MRNPGLHVCISCSAPRLRAWLYAPLVMLAALVIRAPSAPAAPPHAPVRPVDIIFDTDIGNDIDDVLALGLIHALQSRGECRLLAVTITKDSPLAPPFTDAVNTFYDRG
ncbi:MAG: hypothetical protein ACKOTB_14455, partial [Planctomycetia bacterium]